MGIAVHEFIALDGVYEDPSWTMQFGFDPRMGDTIGGLTAAADGILLGRRTFEMFAPAWSGRTADDDPGAPFFNDTEKLVVGEHEPSVEWANTTRLGGYDAETLRRLKGERGLYVSGSGTLVRGMLADGLVDELHLFVFPIALGRGERLFQDGSSPTTLSLLGSKVFDNGVVHLSYGPA